MRKIFLVLLLTIFLGLYILLFWNSFTSPFERDEGEYAYSAWLLRTGNGTPYQDSFLQKPPLIIYTYLLAQLINPSALWPPRALAAIFTIVTAILIWLIAKKEWSEKAAWISIFLFLPMISFPVLTPFAANTERFMILPLTALIALYVYQNHGSQSINYRATVCGSYLKFTRPFNLLGLLKQQSPPFLAGVLFSLTIFYKPIGLLTAGAVLLIWLFRDWRGGSWKNAVRSAFWMLAGTTITAQLILLPFIVSKRFPYFWEETIVFNYSYLGAFGESWNNFLGYLLKFLSYWWILLLPIFWLLISVPRRIGFYLTLLAVSLLTIFTTPIGHYYLMIMPLLCLIIAASLDSFLNILPSPKQSAASMVLIIVFFLTMLWPFRNQFSLSPSKLTDWVYGTVNPFGESVQVAEVVKRITQPTDYIFVAGSEPQIYYYSQRKSPTRFVITYPLNLETSYREKYQKELVDNLQKNPPTVIVVSQRAHSGLWNEGSPTIFINYLKHLLQKEYKLKGGYVWEEGTSYWQEPIRPEEINNSSFLVFVKSKHEESNTQAVITNDQIPNPK